MRGALFTTAIATIATLASSSGYAKYTGPELSGVYLYTGNIACTGPTSIRSNIQTGTLTFHADTHTYDFKAVITTVSPGSPPESNTVINPGIPYKIKSPIAIKGFGDKGTLFLGSVVNNIATSALISAADANCGYQYTLTKIS